jgi:AcrR family transcriptional regulator
MSDERERLSEAIVDVVIEHGHDGASVAEVARRVGLPEEAFYRHFESFDKAVLQIYRYRMDDFNSLLRDAYEREERWPDSLRAAGYVAARYIRDDPRIVRFSAIEMFHAGEMAQIERERPLQWMVDIIDAGRQEMDDPDELDRTTAEATFGAAYEVVRQVIKSGNQSAEEALPGLMYMAVRPYLGHEVASKELTIPAPPERPVARPGAQSR